MHDWAMKRKWMDIFDFSVILSTIVCKCHTQPIHIWASGVPKHDDLISYIKSFTYVLQQIAKKQNREMENYQ